MTNTSSELSDSEEQITGEDSPHVDETTGSGELVDSSELAAASEVASALSHDAEATVEPQTGAGSREIPADLLQRIVEGALLAAGKPLAVDDLAALFEDDERPAPQAIRDALAAIGQQSVARGFELREVASGFRFQVVQEVAPWIARLWEEKPQKYSRALLETLALIAYRQPITRGDIEDIRGVAVATNIIKTLLERDWVRVVGHKDVPGRPAMYATTRRFLDYFNLKNLDELPALADLRDLDALSAQLSLEGADTLLPEQQEGEAAEVQADGEDATAPTGSDDTNATAIDAANLQAGSGDGAESPAAEAAGFEEPAIDTAADDAEPLESRPDAQQSED